MGIDLGRLDVVMSQQFLNGTDVVSRLQEMSGKTVPQRVRGGPLGYARAAHRRLHGLLDRSGVHVVPFLPPAVRVDCPVHGREEVPPALVERGARVFPRQCEGQ